MVDSKPLNRDSNKRVHNSCLVATGLLIVAYFLVMVPGNRQHAATSVGRLTYWEHGWPLVHGIRIDDSLSRDFPNVKISDLVEYAEEHQRFNRAPGLEDSLLLAIPAPTWHYSDGLWRRWSWLEPDSWAFSYEGYYTVWDYFRLSINLIAFVVLAGLFYLVCEFFRRRKSRWFQITILEFLLLAVLAAGAFGFWRNQRNVSQAVQDAKAELVAIANEQSYSNSRYYLNPPQVSQSVPVWLDRLFLNRLGLLTSGSNQEDLDRYLFARDHRYIFSDVFKDNQRLSAAIQRIDEVKAADLLNFTPEQFRTIVDAWGDDLLYLQLVASESDGSDIARCKNLKALYVDCWTSIKNLRALSDLDHLTRITANAVALPDLNLLPRKARQFGYTLDRKVDLSPLADHLQLVNLDLNYLSYDQPIDPADLNFPFEMTFPELRNLNLIQFVLTPELTNWIVNQPKLRFVHLHNTYREAAALRMLHEKRPELVLFHQAYALNYRDRDSSESGSDAND